MYGWNIFMMIYNPDRYLQNIYDQTGVHKPLLIYNILALIGTIVSLILNFNITPIKCFAITVVLYIIVTCIMNFITKAELMLNEIVNILLHGLLYYILGILILLSFASINQYIIILFGVLSIISYIIFIRTLCYFCTYRNITATVIFIILGFLLNIFNIAAGVKTYCRANDINIEDFDYGVRGFYYIKPSEDLEEDYQNIFGDGEYSYSGVDEDGNLLKTLPSTSEDLY